MKVIFVDFDGVLNDATWMRNVSRAQYLSIFDKDKQELDPARVKMISDLALEFNAAIVISSSWRVILSLEAIEKLLRSCGLDEQVKILGKTPRDPQGFRGNEVQEWLNSQPSAIEKYVIFDDDGDFHSTQPLVQTSWDSGLEQKHIDAAREILNKG